MRDGMCQSVARSVEQKIISHKKLRILQVALARWNLLQQTGKEINDRPGGFLLDLGGTRVMENACCTCRWHEGYTWICFNGESPNCADMTDPENTCECWEARTEENGIGDYEVN